jgi:hypothetical protein
MLSGRRSLPYCLAAPFLSLPQQGAAGPDWRGGWCPPTGVPAVGQALVSPWGASGGSWPNLLPVFRSSNRIFRSSDRT